MWNGCSQNHSPHSQPEVTLPSSEATFAKSQPLWEDSPHIRDSFWQKLCHWGRRRSLGWWSQDLLLVKQSQHQTLPPWAGQCLGYCWRAAGNAEGVHTVQEGFTSPSSSPSILPLQLGHGLRTSLASWFPFGPNLLHCTHHTALLSPQEEDLICWRVTRKKSLHKLFSLTTNSSDRWHLEYKRLQTNIPSLLVQMKSCKLPSTFSKGVNTFDPKRWLCTDQCLPWLNLWLGDVYCPNPSPRLSCPTASK